MIVKHCEECRNNMENMIKTKCNKLKQIGKELKKHSIDERNVFIRFKKNDTREMYCEKKEKVKRRHRKEEEQKLNKVVVITKVVVE